MLLPYQSKQIALACSISIEFAKKVARQRKSIWQCTFYRDEALNKYTQSIAAHKKELETIQRLELNAGLSNLSLSLTNTSTYELKMYFLASFENGGIYFELYPHRMSKNRERALKNLNSEVIWPQLQQCGICSRQQLFACIKNKETLLYMDVSSAVKETPKAFFN